MKERGKLLVLEGGVGCGKSTQAELLRKHLKGWEFFREPGSTAFGENIRDAVQGHEYEVDKYGSFLAYSAARADLIRRVVFPRLAEGRSVLLDRYWYSTFAYQGAEGVSKPLIWAISLLTTKAVKPNLVLHYDLLPEIGLARKKGHVDADRYDIKELEFHRKVRKNYWQLKRLYPGIWRVIDASRPPAKVLEESLQTLKEFGLI
jgi:dTMP kinase